MKTLLSHEDRMDLEKRINRLTIFRRPRWGRMLVTEALIHLMVPLMVARGEKKIPFEKGSFFENPILWACSLPIINWIASQWFPWWEGAPTAPGFMEGLNKGVDIATNKKELIREMRDFTAAAKNHLKKFPPHPVFGELSKEQWARLMWRHIDWHLCQFGK